MNLLLRISPCSFVLRSVSLTLSALFAITSLGCGTNESTPSDVVPPPARTVETPSTDSGNGFDARLDGGLELPEGEIPSPTSSPDSDPGEAKSGGIEMPADLTPDPPSPNDGANAKLPTIRYASWEEIQSSAANSGKVTVVDLWSLSCEPCLKEFPGLVSLHRRWGDEVRCMAVDLDYDGRRTRPPQYYADRVVDFLMRVGAADLPAFISNTPSDDVFRSMRIPSLPAVLIYDVDGRVVRTFVDAGDTVGFSYEEDIVPLVSDLAKR